MYPVTLRRIGRCGWVIANQWADEHGMRVPGQAFFDEISRDLGKKLNEVTGHPIEVVPEERNAYWHERPYEQRPPANCIAGPCLCRHVSARPRCYIDATRAVHEVVNADGSRTFPSAGGLRPALVFHP